ncbi:hypothetical protein DSC45_27310 [Streptomyces sp. YIM 130001]|uniref:LPXTG cell wall anchor domain-containing protein n=1 Tax=Streptomyces sp. YIM 130001 TaxID=2259644 RepID=UPI000E649D93|nr:LPXTG cell wall anchor domain-containing protein [Streptomyces sp. YIM 130001]RII12006.1 hypothetical protein DSC45_27310 [Streptomyces sp. YIM 130001]
MLVSPRARRRSAFGALACGTALAAGSLAPAAAAEAPDERRVQVVMVGFTDDSFADPAATEAMLEKAYFGDSESLTSYYNEVTRDATTFAPASGDGVLGGIELPMSASGCDSGRIAELTEKALAGKGVTEDDYEHLSIVFPSEKAGCDYAGLGSVGGGTTWMPNDGKEMSMTALVHEFGHNFGYGHHMRLRCPGTDLSACKETEDTSHKTPMGGGGWAAGLTAPELIHSKWLNGDEAVRVAKSGTYELRSLYGTGDGVRALDIPVGDDRLVVEFRAGSGNLDQGIEGVHAYRVTGTEYAESALVDTTPDADHHESEGAPDADALAAGKTLADPSAEVEVKVVDAGEDSAKVAVSLDGVPAPAAAKGGAKGGGSSEDASGAEPQTERTKAAESAAGQDTSAGKADGDLAATGAESDQTLPSAVGGGLLLAVGAVFLLRSRRGRATRV